MKTIAKSFWFIILCGLGAGELFAQVGNNNPTGVAGDFNGDITTGCRYDPYTGNAKREVTDIVVAGGVGVYPLAFTRTANSRYSVGQDDVGNGQSADFGSAGNWLHSYQWTINPKSGAAKPTSFTVNYPDGRIVTFTASTNGDPYYRGGQGIRDRLQVFWDSSTAGRAYLIMQDGGKVFFTITITTCGSTCKNYSYTLQSITDPYGQTTTVTGSPQSGLVTITEPAGRWIKLYYTTPSSNPNDYFIYQLTASDGRSIQYGYNSDPNWPSLIQVTYFNDSNLVASYTYQADNTGNSGNQLLLTCVDPMYQGPMWGIVYQYATGTNPDGTAVVYGQIQAEKSSGNGTLVSSLTINSATTRTETRGDGKTRTFTYNPTPLLISWTDFLGVSSSQTYDSNGYANAVTDRNGHTTNFTNNAFTGRLLTETFPSTSGDTPPNTPRGVVSYTYGSASCADSNNKDANNPYYDCTATDEAGNVTNYFRDSAKRITQINYPDGGSESFVYNSFGQVTSHTLKTGGTEIYSYDGRGLLQTYRDAYHATGNPSFWYQYDSLDRVSGITDALGTGSGDINHTTSYTHNSRGQVLVLTHPTDPVDNQRHTLTRTYNPEGTVASISDELNHTTSYGYDPYKRIITVATPGHNTALTTSIFYDANGTNSWDFTHTDSNPTWITSPTGKNTNNTYDGNHRLLSTTKEGACSSGSGGGLVGPPVCSDAATTSYRNDNMGNVTTVISPNEQPGQIYSGFSTTATYDERNRPMLVTDAQNGTTTFKYDAAGHRASITRANGQVISYDSYDAMNRLQQQTAKQMPDPDAVTKYTYYTSGLLHTMQDPRLVANNSQYNYSYVYDQMGRKTSLTYPPDSGGVQRTELWHYDTAGRNDTFTNRATNVETFTYDALNRMINSSWNDGLTPSVAYRYDVASRMVSVVNSNATISRSYFNDNLLYTETTTYADNTPRVITYNYDADGNRSMIQYPNGAYSFTYSYTGRNQLLKLLNGNNTVVTYGYDPDGNLKSRAPDNSTISSFIYDALDRVTHISHALNGTTRTLDYAYDAVGNRKWTKRDGGNGDVFGYDLNDESMSVLLNVSNPDTTTPGNQTISYDANGNRTTFSPYGTTDTYASNNLNQYTLRNTSTARYDSKGNMTMAFDNSTYAYDALNRLTGAAKGGTTETFNYDGLNRQISRTVGAAAPVYSVYDGWAQIAEYAPGASNPSNAYVFSAGGLLKNLVTNQYYYQDASGSTSHLSDSGGNLIEWYRYDLHGAPFFYNVNNMQITASTYGVRYLFNGQQWYSELGLYDLRNRFYSPDIGRFLQADPLSFAGDPTNLYRYCGNNPIMYMDPFGLYSGFLGGGGSSGGAGAGSSWGPSNIAPSEESGPTPVDSYSGGYGAGSAVATATATATGAGGATTLAVDSTIPYLPEINQLSVSGIAGFTGDSSALAGLETGFGDAFAGVAGAILELVAENGWAALLGLFLADDNTASDNSYFVMRAMESSSDLGSDGSVGYGGTRSYSPGTTLGAAYIGGLSGGAYSGGFSGGFGGGAFEFGDYGAGGWESGTALVDAAGFGVGGGGGGGLIRTAIR